MRIWIDTEFNEFKGDLISMALVAEDGQEWYEVTYCENPGQWVAQNVMPILNKDPIPKIEMQTGLSLFLSRYPSVHIIADWPEDIAHFCNLLITGPGYRLDTPPLTMEIRRDLDAVSLLPHNALADARAIMRKHLDLDYFV
jgi:hypothetical protein